MSKFVTLAALVALASACGGSAKPAEPPGVDETQPSENPGTIAPVTDEKTTPTEPGPWPVPTSSTAPEQAP